jgi:uncharacterized protein
MANIVSLYRYPVKGLSPEAIETAALEAGKHFPGDRLFALENGSSGFDPTAAQHMPKIKFLMLARIGKLARLHTLYDDLTSTLSIRDNGRIVAAGNVRTEHGRSNIEAFFNQFCHDDLRGPVKLLTAPAQFRFMDSKSGLLSIVNLESVQAIARIAGKTVLDPIRFRANTYVNGLGAWGEFDLVGKQMMLGTATIEITARIDRCAATDVEPTSGARDMKMINLLEQEFGHHDCGVYARIISSGVVKTGDEFVPC